MPVEEFLQKAESVLDELGQLAGPISSLPEGQWHRSLSEDGDASTNLGEIGRLRLTGAIGVEAFVTDTPQPPFDLASPVPNGNSGVAYCSTRLSGRAGANFDTNVAGAMWKAGVSGEASGVVAWTVHRRLGQDHQALAALRDTLGRLVQNPFTEIFLHSMEPGEAFQYDLEGRVAVQASAGLEYGVFREFRPTEAFGVDNPIGVKAGLKAAITVHAGLEGELHIRLTREAGSKRRLRLFKKRGSSVGVGLGLNASLQFAQVDPFVKSLIGRFFELPDGLAERVQALQDRAGEIQQRLDGLEADAKSAIEELLGEALETIGLDRIEALLQNFDSQPALVQSALDPIRQATQSFFGEVAEAREALSRFVGDLFEKVDKPLEEVNEKLSSWLDAYSRLKTRLQDNVAGRVKKGIELEIKAAISRSRSREALLDLEFDISHDRALSDCVKAMLGDFTDALMSARADGANGVELLDGALKRTIQKRRTLGLKANFFGFEVSKDLQTWSEVTVEENLVAGTLEVFGQAGAALVQKIGKERDDLTFVFDFFGGALDDHQRPYLAVDAGYRAELSRGGETQNPEEIAFDVERHLELAAALGPFPDTVREPIRQALLAAEGPYRYSIHLAFTPAAIRRALILDQPTLEASASFAFIWAKIRHASSLLGDHVRDVEGTILPLSSFLNPALSVLKLHQDVKLEDFHMSMPFGQPPLSGAARASILVRARNAYQFATAYAVVRERVATGGSVKAVVKNLRTMARRVGSTPGTFGEPLDAKFLALALAAGPEHVQTSLRLERGEEVIEI